MVSDTIAEAMGIELPERVLILVVMEYGLRQTLNNKAKN